jgi:uncharacterized protein YukE
MGTRVDPAALLRAAGAADRLAGGVRRESADVETDTASGTRALSGFRTREALERLQYGWSDALQRHHDYLDQLGNSLSTAARGYRQSDATVAAYFAGLNRF